MGADGAVWHIWETAPNSEAWSAWASLGAPPQANLLEAAYSIVAMQNQDGRVEIFLTDLEWNVWHIGKPQRTRIGSTPGALLVIL